MGKPQLYWTKLSPPSRAVFMTAKLLDVELDLVQTSPLAGDHLKPEFLKVYIINSIVSTSKYNTTNRIYIALRR